MVSRHHRVDLGLRRRNVCGGGLRLRVGRGDLRLGCGDLRLGGGSLGLGIGQRRFESSDPVELFGDRRLE